MTIAVFGASNQVGAALLPLLLDGGHRVQAVSRHPRPPWIRPHDRMDWVQWDLGQPPATPLASDAMVYAAPLDRFPRALEACPGVRRVVAFSSTSRQTKQDSPVHSERALARALAAGEDGVARHCDGRSVDWVILRPTIIYGMGLDRSLSRLARWARRWPVWLMPAAGCGLRQPVHAEDLAAAALAALDPAVPGGGRYDLPGGETLSYREMLSRIAASQGRRLRWLRLPAVLGRWAVAVARWMPGWRDLTPGMLARIDRDLVFDAGPALADLDYRPRPFRPVAETWIRVDRRPGTVGSGRPDRG